MSSVSKTLDDDDSDIEFIGASTSISKPGTLDKKNRKSQGSSNNKKRKFQGPGKKSSDGPSDVILATWGRGDDDMEPSAKMLALLEMLKEWDVTGDKTIVYSQCKLCPFELRTTIDLRTGTSMLDLIEILFSRHGIRSLRFDGRMGREARDAVLVTFKQSGGPKVILIRYEGIYSAQICGRSYLLVSTKCGSVG